jgi:hypothetical protein
MVFLNGSSRKTDPVYSSPESQDLVFEEFPAEQCEPYSRRIVVQEILFSVLFNWGIPVYCRKKLWPLSEKYVRILISLKVKRLFRGNDFLSCERIRLNTEDSIPARHKYKYLT